MNDFEINPTKFFLTLEFFFFLFLNLKETPQAAGGVSALILRLELFFVVVIIIIL